MISRAVAYARVSSATQRDRDTIASQLRVLPEFIARMGWNLVKPIDTYIDDGRTAKAGHLEARLGLAALLRDAAAGVFDVVVVVDLDRLTRSEDIAERGAILGAFQRAGVRVASAASGQVLDLSTSIGDLFGTLQAFFAAEENRKRRERTVQGKLTAIQRSRKPSGPTPYGLAYDRETGVWSVDPVTGPIVIEIYERIAAGDACKTIAEDFERRGIRRPRGRWSGERVWGIARSRHTLGEWTVDKRRKLTISVPAIVTAAQWQRAQDALIAHGKRGLRRTKHVYLLEGLARCGACGGRIMIRSACGRPRNVPAYVCRNRKLDLPGVVRCTAEILTVPDVDGRVWGKLCELVRNPELLDSALAERRDHADDPADWKADADGYRRRIEQADRAESALLERFSRGKISERAMDVELERLSRERAALRDQLLASERAAAAATNAHARVDSAKRALLQIGAQVANASPASRRELVEALVLPGSVTFQGREIRLSVRPLAAAASRAAAGVVSVALVSGSGWDPSCESDVEIRLVA